MVKMILAVNTLIQELGSTKTYECTSFDDKSIVGNHCYHITTKFAVGIKEDEEQLPMLYGLPKPNKGPYKARSLQILIHAQPLNCLV